MKRILCITICLLLLFSITACSLKQVDLIEGAYYAVGDYHRGATPLIRIYPDKNEFDLSAGIVYSYAERGTYEIDGNKLIATSQSTTFIFKIKDSTTLELIDIGNNDYFMAQLNTQFVFSEEFK